MAQPNLSTRPWEQTPTTTAAKLQRIIVDGISTPAAKEAARRQLFALQYKLPVIKPPQFGGTGGGGGTDTPTTQIDQNQNQNTGGYSASSGGGGYAAPAKVVDQAQLNSLDSLLASLDQNRGNLKHKAALTRDSRKREKEDELKREKGKYEGKKVTTLQDFAGAKVDTDINTRNTLESLISSLSTMGLGGSRALTRQILDAANKSNRKANATQATNNQNLDTAYNEFKGANDNDVRKIDDQYGYDVGQADKEWGEKRRDIFYKKADVYNAADKTAEREALMNEGNGLNSFISNSTFLNPSYTGESRQMATPDLASYNQAIAKYDTRNIGASPDTTTPGNLAIKAIAVNDKDLGVKKKIEGLDPVLGV